MDSLIKTYKDTKKEEISEFEAKFIKEYCNNMNENDVAIIKKYERACNMLNYTFELTKPYEGRVEIETASGWVTLPQDVKVKLLFKNNQYHPEFYQAKILSGEMKGAYVIFDAFKALNDGARFY